MTTEDLVAKDDLKLLFVAASTAESQAWRRVSADSLMGMNFILKFIDLLKKNQTQGISFYRENNFGEYDLFWVWVRGLSYADILQRAPEFWVLMDSLAPLNLFLHAVREPITAQGYQWAATSWHPEERKFTWLFSQET